MKTFNRHCAYNLTTGEIVTCPNGNHLKKFVRIISKSDKECGIHGEWIFGHKGIDAIAEKANRISKQRMGRK